MMLKDIQLEHLNDVTNDMHLIVTDKYYIRVDKIDKTIFFMCLKTNIKFKMEYENNLEKCFDVCKNKFIGKLLFRVKNNGEFANYKYFQSVDNFIKTL